MTQMIELVDKDDKITIINKYYIYKKVEKNMTKKERKDIKRPKLKFQRKTYFRQEIIGFGQQQIRHCRKN